ncbi:MAG: tyrosine--tRNA ligase [Bacilli bacterium]|jgi:tyrosyl-tRNA synthetase
MKLYDDLKWRGLLKDMAGDDLEEKLNQGGMTFYWGTDPTADSLHLGHYSSLLTAKRLAASGHHPILLIGGATGLIGDPRPTTERAMSSKEELLKNIESIKKQITSLFGYEVVNNYDWCKDINMLDFLRDYGKFFNVNYMCNKDIIKRRIDTGITYTEFSYMIIQALDFLYLYETKNCVMQVEGSDQWGNITAGLDLIKRKTNKDLYAFTMPLVTDSYGNKFGKSEGNALWLDKNKTSSYELYQYLVNVEDSMVISYLKIFTFLNKEEIEALEKSNKEDPHLRLAHKALAKEIITDLHGHGEYEKAVKISEALFSGDIKNLSVDEINDGFKNVPSFDISVDINIIDLLASNGICSSKREAKELVEGAAVSVNGSILSSFDYIVTRDKAIDNKYTVIRRGKKKYYLIKHI